MNKDNRYNKDVDETPICSGVSFILKKNLGISRDLSLSFLSLLTRLSFLSYPSLHSCDCRLLYRHLHQKDFLYNQILAMGG